LLPLYTESHFTRTTEKKTVFNVNLFISSYGGRNNDINAKDNDFVIIFFCFVDINFHSTCFASTTTAATAAAAAASCRRVDVDPQLGNYWHLNELISTFLVVCFDTLYQKKLY
jgi:hypothetical protein